MNHHWYGKKIKIGCSNDKCYYRQCKKCRDILFIVKTGGYHGSEYSIDEKSHYSISWERLYFIPKGSISNECSIYNDVLCVGLVPEKREIVPYKQAKHDWEKVDFFHECCRDCGLIKLQFEFPRCGGVCLEEYYDVYHEKLRFLGDFGCYNCEDVEQGIKCVDKRSEVQEKIKI